MYITPGQGQNNTWWHLENIKIQSICQFAASFALQMTSRKICQGHPRGMIYINFEELHSWMLHVKFQNHRLSGSAGEDFSKVFCYV